MADTTNLDFGLKEEPKTETAADIVGINKQTLGQKLKS